MIGLSVDAQLRLEGPDVLHSLRYHLCAPISSISHAHTLLELVARRFSRLIVLVELLDESQVIRDLLEWSFFLSEKLLLLARLRGVIEHHLEMEYSLLDYLSVEGVACVWNGDKILHLFALRLIVSATNIDILLLWIEE